MVKPLFDTNILIDHLNAIPQAAQEFDRYDSAAISVITWMEVLAGARNDVADATRRFLAGFQVIPLEASSRKEPSNSGGNTASSFPTR